MPPRRLRLDAELVRRGLARSREHASELIAEGRVKVSGVVATKPATGITTDVAIVVREDPDRPEYVSRGGHKLAGALAAFAEHGLDVQGRRCLDAGASTGGFTDVLLQRDAVSVIALDVGRGQLDWRLRTDPRVVVRERVNARALTDHDVPHQVDLVTIDVSFISLRHIFPALPRFLAAHADIVALVKPQFEAGRAEVGKHGLVTDPAVHDAVIARVTAEAELSGLSRAGMTPSPITGATGNREFFLHLRRQR
jgi:23S rRNA (cytidine1920-2'-O)/16S rRNA (cytidine1409-2'-O)-methyltransferase